MTPHDAYVSFHALASNCLLIFLISMLRRMTDNTRSRHRSFTVALAISNAYIHV
jgi:hypothetical protein